MKKFFEVLSMVALLIWGGMFLYFYFSGRVDDYLVGSFRKWVPISGIGMIILGALNLINHKRGTGACSHDHVHGDHTHCDHDHDHDHHHHHDHDHDHDHGHDHHHEEATASSLAFALIVLLVPLISSAKFSQDSFSKEYKTKWMEIEDDMRKLRQQKASETSDTIAQNENPYTNPDGTRTPEEESGDGGEDAWGEFTIEDLKKMVPQTSAGNFLLDVPQIYYTAGDQELMKVMEGISIETIAQVIEDTVDDSPENRLRAYRLMIECCAADARPLSIPIDFAEALPEYEEMGWYKLIGRLHFHKTEDHEYIPLLQIKSFDPTPEPADWMAY